MLGPAQGELWLGRRLELRIPVRMDPGLPLVAQCVGAELLDGDTAVPAHELHLSVHGRPGDWFIELRSPRALRAAVVQLTLRMGCQFRMQRHYTLLVDPAPLPDAGASARVAGAPAGQPQHSARRAALRQGERPAHEARRQAEPPHRMPSHAAGPATPRAGPADRSSRLRLDWLARSIAPQPSRQLRQLESRLDSLHAQLRELQSQEAAMQARLQALHAQDLARQHEVVDLRGRPAQTRRDPSAWWNGAWLLLAAVCGLLAAVLWRGRRRQVDTPWRLDLPARHALAGAEPAAGAAAGASPGTRPATRSHADLPLERAEPARPVETAAAAQPAPVDRELFQRPLTPPEQLQIDEVVDHGHLADFFIGIGEPDKAIDVMRRALDEAGGEFSALPYLVLFDLYRRTGRRADYEQLERECGSRLNLRIPHWDEGQQRASRDLLDYPRALRLLGEVWGTPACLTVIERMIADDPRGPRAGFELAAYRDLLDLYALVRELQRPASAAATASDPDSPEPDPQPELDLELELELAAAPLPAQEGSPFLRSGWSSSLSQAPDDEASTLPPLDFAWSTLPPLPPAAPGR